MEGAGLWFSGGCHIEVLLHMLTDLLT